MTNIGTIEGGGQQAQEFGLPETHDPFNPEEVAYMLAAMLGKRNFVDALGVCSFTVNTYVELICQALNALTGWDYTKEEAMLFGKRSAAMFRLFNLRCGIGVDLERPSERYWVHSHRRPGGRHQRQGQLGDDGVHLLQDRRMGQGDGQATAGDHARTGAAAPDA